MHFSVQTSVIQGKRAPVCKNKKKKLITCKIHSAIPSTGAVKIAPWQKMVCLGSCGTHLLQFQSVLYPLFLLLWAHGAAPLPCVLSKSPIRPGANCCSGTRALGKAADDHSCSPAGVKVHLRMCPCAVSSLSSFWYRLLKSGLVEMQIN